MSSLSTKCRFCYSSVFCYSENERGFPYGFFLLLLLFQILQYWKRWILTFSLSKRVYLLFFEKCRGVGITYESAIQPSSTELHRPRFSGITSHRNLYCGEQIIQIIAIASSLSAQPATSFWKEMKLLLHGLHFSKLCQLLLSPSSFYLEMNYFTAYFSIFQVARLNA